MNKRVWIFWLILSAFASAYAEPKFSDYHVKPDKKKPAKIHYSSETAKKYQDVIEKNVGKRPNFSGHYTMVEYSCGTGCTQLLLVDRRNGKVKEVKLEGFSEFGYTADSKLLIGTHHCVMDTCPKEYFLYKKGKWKPIKQK